MLTLGSPSKRRDSQRVRENLSADRGHSDPCELGCREGGHGLNIGGQDLVMLVKVNLKSVAGPASFDLHYFERHPSEEVFESGSNPDAVPLNGFNTCCFGCCLEMFDKGVSGEGFVLRAILVGEKGPITRGVIDGEVGHKCSEWVCWSILFGPVDLFTIEV